MARRARLVAGPSDRAEHRAALARPQLGQRPRARPASPARSLTGPARSGRPSPRVSRHAAQGDPGEHGTVLWLTEGPSDMVATRWTAPGAPTATHSRSPNGRRSRATTCSPMRSAPGVCDERPADPPAIPRARQPSHRTATLPTSPDNKRRGTEVPRNSGQPQSRSGPPFRRRLRCPHQGGTHGLRACCSPRDEAV
jgi:hypothetical protein